MDKSITEPERLIIEGADEFRRAAAKTATGIIEQGVAVLKIKQGCAKKQGGSDFLDIAMRLLGLPNHTASWFVTIGQNANKLLSVDKSLPGDAVSTLYQIARMPPDVIADKIERGVITPTASRTQVLEKTIVRTSRTVVSTDDEVVSSIKDIVGKLSKKEQKALFAEVDAARKLEREAATKEAKAQLTAIQAERRQIDRARAELRIARRMVLDPFTADEFKKILGMLHPDRHPGNEARAKEVFETFSRIKPICKKRNLKAV